jgi:RHS repeat-associated protein
LLTFKYDPFGRRIEKISPNATSIFVYDGDNLVETVNSSGAFVARYTQGQNTDEPLAMLRGSTTDYYQADGLGSITSLSNTSGALAQTYTYDSFGNQTATSGSLTNFFHYAGRELDTETNLYYNRARYLDPSTGRFLSEDPVRYLGGLNFYAYAQNNPPDLADPLGLSSGCTLIGSTQIASWTTATRQYTTPWTFAFATTGEGGPDRDSGALLMILNCHWQRNYVRDLWQTKLYLNTYLCTDKLPCGLSISWFEFSVDTKKNYLGEEPGGTETTTTSRQLLGYDSEFLNRVYCNSPFLVPAN